MAIKLIVTYACAGAAVHGMGDVERWSEIFEIDHPELERALKPSLYSYTTITLSHVPPVAEGK